MISIFHFIALFCAISGLVFGAAAGHAYFGWWGVLLAIPGAYFGLVIGRLPRVIIASILRRRENADFHATKLHR